MTDFLRIAPLKDKSPSSFMIVVSAALLIASLDDVLGDFSDASPFKISVTRF